MKGHLQHRKRGAHDEEDNDVYNEEYLDEDDDLSEEGWERGWMLGYINS